MSSSASPRSIRLCEGVCLRLIPHDKTKNNHLSIHFLSDLNKETAAYAALLARVLTRGCAAYPTLRDISARLDGCYGADIDAGVDKFGETHTLTFSCDWLKDAYSYDGMAITETVLETARQILFYPLLEKTSGSTGFLAEYVRSEKENLYDTIAAEINNKATYARKRMYEIMCEGEPFAVSILGEKDVLEAITPSALYDFYLSMLKSAQVEIYFAGSGVDEIKLQNTLRSFFEEIARDIKPLAPPMQITKNDTISRDETMDINQAHLVLGYRTGITMQQEGYAAFSVFNALFGGAVSSRLFAIIREKMHLCYTVTSSPESIKGVMLVYAGIAEENREKAHEGIRSQLSLIAKGDFTDKELEDARAYMHSVLQGLEDSPSALSTWYLVRQIAGITDASPQKSMEALQSVTRKDVMKAANSIRESCVYFLAPERSQA